MTQYYIQLIYIYLVLFIFFRNTVNYFLKKLSHYNNSLQTGKPARIRIILIDEYPDIL